MSVSPKERFLGICHFERPGELCMLGEPLNNFFWGETLRKWVEQGAPREIMSRRFRREYFRFERIRPLVRTNFDAIGEGREEDVQVPPKIDLGDGTSVSAGRSRGVIPAYQPRLISQDESTVTYVNGAGQTVKCKKDRLEGMPTYLDWPVRDRASWNEHKKGLDPDTPERWPSDWDAYVKKMNGKSEILSLPVGGFYGYLREWVGSEKILYMFYDDPSLIEDMMETVLHLETEIIKRILKDIKIQQAAFWEDMCYRAGPLISPAMVRKFMMPRYRKMIDLLHSYGVDVIFLDCDGNVEQLIPLWLEVGINYIWPFEVAAGNDAVAVRKKYGKDLIIGGTIDKRVLAKDKKAIKEEVISKVPFLLEQGGYFPSVDHAVPPDVTFENYCYFINTMREVGGLEKLSFR